MPDPEPAPGGGRRKAVKNLFRREWGLLVNNWGWIKALLKRHYVAIVIVSALVISLGALLIGLWRIPFLVNGLLNDLQANAGDPEKTRGNVVALAAVLAAITIIGTLITQSIRVWTSERQTHTIEQGHVTDRLTKAIELLGAEKTVKFIDTDAEGAELRDVEHFRRVIETTVPNLEVRLGAIYALERIAKDSERDHVTIMEILCAYIRENAKGSEAPPSPLVELPERGAADLSERKDLLAKRRSERQNWLTTQPQPRIDVQAALTVIGRRDEARRQTKAASSFSLDLRDANLRRADLSGARLEGADLRGARLEGANLGEARLKGANLWGARLEGTDLSAARLEGTNLWGARLEGTDLSAARLEGANLGGVRLEGANLRGARLEGAHLSMARLEGANLGGAEMEGAYLRGARLEGADLSGARLERADLNAALLEGANLAGARLEGTNLGGADMEGANLSWARLEGANLSWARLEGAYLREARLERAVLGGARLEGATLFGARLEGANLGVAEMGGANLFGAGLEGADLREADFRNANWAGASNRASPAQFADFRTGQDLAQSQLEHFIGNDDTLLPDRLNENGEPYYVWSCWETPPENFESIITAAAGPNAKEDERRALRRQFLAGPDNPRVKTGTPLALDAPYPEGHPLATRD